MTHIDLGWELSDIADSIDGVLVGDEAVVRRVETDTRADLTDALFVALRGERFDGHTFADEAITGGAVAVVVEAGASASATPRIEVASTADALLALGAKRRAELHMPVIAITGSAGKTSTKDLLAAGIPGSYSSPKSFNNEVGVPLTVLGAPDTATALILEVGSRGRGHIAWLGSAVRPDVSVVTNLGVVHLETFGTTTTLADAKYELVELLGPDGTAVLPVDEPRLDRPGTPDTITFGVGAGDVSVDDIELDTRGFPTFTVKVASRTYPCSLAMAGAHQARNAAAAVGAALALGRDIGSFISAMESATGSAWRMDVHHGTYTVVNDAYNANPQSVASALRTIAHMEGRRHVAVLGPMAELGSVCEREHEAIGRLAADLGIDDLIVVGADHGYGIGAGPITRNATGLQEAADTLHAILEPGDVVLVKASRSAGLERLALDLIEAATP